jgi:hypothetical protein
MPLAGELVRASDAVPDDWTAYTPVWTASTAPALGNGTLTGAYMQVGDLVFIKIVLSPGSTTTFGTGPWRFSLPVTPEIHSLIPGLANDASAVDRSPVAAWVFTALASGDNMRIGTSTGVDSLGSLIPFTWASGDTLVLSGSYRPN